MNRNSFIIVAQYHHANGDEMRIIKLHNRGPEEQRKLFMASVVGYDPHHPDAPDTAVYKFATPNRDQWTLWCLLWNNMFCGRIRPRR